MSDTWNKAAVDEFLLLKEKVLHMKKEMAAANKKIRALEPEVKQVILKMHAQEGGSPESDVMPVLLFQEKRKVIELKMRRRSPALNIALVEAVLRLYLAKNTQLTLAEVDDFILFLKSHRKDTQKAIHVLQYREAKLSELSEPGAAPLGSADADVPENNLSAEDDVTSAIRL